MPSDHRRTASGRPIMVLLDLLGRRWALRVLWELSPSGPPLPFRVLQGRCEEMSSSVLNQRLKELREAGLVQLGEGGYSLTSQAEGLVTVLLPLDAWARTQWSGMTGRAPERQTDGSSNASSSSSSASPV